MANNYLQFSFAVPVSSDECRKWIIDLLSQAEQDERTAEFETIFPEFGDTEELGFSWDLGEPSDAIWIYAEESGDTESVVRFLAALIERPDAGLDQVGFGYGCWCSSMRPGEFGGGAIIVYLDDSGGAQVKYVDTFEWLTTEQV